MDRVHYAGGSILTGSEIAHILMDYAQALAQTSTAAAVVVPTIDEQGTLGSAEILVGPSSQMLTKTEWSDVPDPVDDAWIERYRGEAEHLRRDGTPVSIAVTDDEATVLPPAVIEEF